MQLKGQHAIVTGGAHGIGRALAERFAAEGARGVVVADLDIEAAREVAARVNGLAVQVDVSAEKDIQRLVAAATERFGPVDLFCSNAGIATGGGPDAPDRDWQRIWEVNLMA
ncbi:MAG TPA: SDR family NAD(P)-dependent oxidoreductase, partial [Pirellulales bacterium]